MISVRNVSKRFGRNQVLRNVSFEIGDDETVAVVGPSGVGKSVLLKLILGIFAPDEGDILIGDRSITKARSEAERNRIRESLGTLFQAAALFDSLTVYENVAFPLQQWHRQTKQEIHSAVVEILCSLSLEDYADLYPEEISIGIRKRVGLARALITRPKVVLFDEPNTGLDPLVGQEVYDLIKKCRSRSKFTGVVISHEIPEVFQVSDRVAMLLGGQLVALGHPLSL